MKKDEAELFEEPQYRVIGVHSAAYVNLKLNVVWFASVIVNTCRKAHGTEIVAD